MRSLITLLSLLGLYLPGVTQDLLVKFETTKVDLYLDYVNAISITIQHEDTLNRYDFHAKAVGAEIDYDAQGRMFVLPVQSKGYVDAFAVVNGELYLAGRFQFDGVKAPPLSDGAFIAAMGITKDDSKRRLNARKNFDPGARKVRTDEKITISAFPIMQLRADDVNVLRVSVVKRGRKDYIPVKGMIDLESSDATITRVDNSTFNVTPVAGKGRCTLSVFLDGKKISDDRMTVFSRSN